MWKLVELLEGQAAHRAEEEERMSVSRQMQPLQCSERICRDVFCFHTRRRRLTVDKRNVWPCILSFLLHYKALILRFAFTSLFKSDFNPEPEAQDTTSYLASCFS